MSLHPLCYPVVGARVDTIRAGGSSKDANNFGTTWGACPVLRTGDSDGRSVTVPHRFDDSRTLVFGSFRYSFFTFDLFLIGIYHGGI